MNEIASHQIFGAMQSFAFDRLADPWVLLLVPILLASLLWSWRGRDTAMRYSSLLAFEGLPLTIRQRLQWLPYALRLLAVLAVAVAAARPQIGHGEVRIEGEGVAIMLVVDRSRSMETPIRYQGRVLTRLEVVKDVIRAFVLGDGKEFSGRSNDPMGLITFAGYAETLVPVVRSPQSIVEMASDIDFIDARLNRQLDGTAIGEGIALAASRLMEVERRLEDPEAGVGQFDQIAGEDSWSGINSKVIVLLTDGEENRGDTSTPEAAELCRELGIRLYTIAIGSDADTQRGFILPRSNPFSMLQRTAELTGGRFFLATDGDALRNIYHEIDQLEKSTIESIEYTRWEERFMAYAMLAAILLSGEILLTALVFRRSA